MGTDGEFDSRAFGARLRRAIEREGTSQAKLAGAIGQTRPRITEWIKGARTPKVKDMIAMAAVLGVSLDWLMTGTETAAPERAVVDGLAQLAPSLLPLVSRAEQLARE